MASGRLAKAGRGELAVPLPAGYARRPSGEVALDPDEQVQAVTRLVFRLFGELGTVHAVLRFLVENQLPGREHSGRVRRLEAGEWLVRIEGALPGRTDTGRPAPKSVPVM